MTNVIKEKDLQYYLNLPYTVTLRKDEDDDFVAKVVELEGCSAHGANPSDALANLDEVKSLWIEDALEAGEKIPLPEDDSQQLPSGKWLQRVPRSLHKKLSERAKREGVSLNQLVTSILAESAGASFREANNDVSVLAALKEVIKVYASSRANVPRPHAFLEERYWDKWGDIQTGKPNMEVFCSFHANQTPREGVIEDDVIDQIAGWIPTNLVIKPGASGQHGKKR